MPAPVRHLLSALLGVFAALAVTFVLPGLMRMMYQTALVLDLVPRLGLYGAFALIGVLVGALAAMRLSPVGALVAGVPLLVQGLLHPTVMVPPLPFLFGGGYPDPAMLILVGGGLIASTAFPHRWRRPQSFFPQAAHPWPTPHNQVGGAGGAVRVAPPSGPQYAAPSSPEGYQYASPSGPQRPYQYPEAPQNSPWPQDPGGT